MVIDGEDVKRFMQANDMDCPSWPRKGKDADACYSGVEQAAGNLRAAWVSKSDAELLDAMAQMVWNTVQFAHSIGFPIDRGIKEARDSMFSLLNAEGKIVRDEKGDVVVPETFVPTNMRAVLDIYGMGAVAASVKVVQPEK